MKNIIAIAILTFMANHSFGVTVKSAKLDSSKNSILIDVTYSGGCGEHDFSLKLKNCRELSPVQCSAELIETTNDACELAINETIANLDPRSSVRPKLQSRQRGARRKSG